MSTDINWPDETEVRSLHGPNGSTAHVVNRYDLLPGMSHQECLEALMARTEHLLKEIEQLKAERRSAVGVSISCETEEPTCSG